MSGTVRFGMVLVAVLGGIGCASVPLPQDEVRHYETSLDFARHLGADKPQAEDGHRGPLGLSPRREHLLLAGDEMATAKDMAREGDQRGALLLARAQSDVDLAVELTREAAVRARLAQFLSAPASNGSALSLAEGGAR